MYCSEDYRLQCEFELFAWELLVFINVNRKDPQAHGYRCSFHPEGFKYCIHRETCKLTTCSNLTRKGE
jgi:hypothetical protein